MRPQPRRVTASLGPPRSPASPPSWDAAHTAPLNALCGFPETSRHLPGDQRRRHGLWGEGQGGTHPTSPRNPRSLPIPAISRAAQYSAAEARVTGLPRGSLHLEKQLRTVQASDPSPSGCSSLPSRRSPGGSRRRGLRGILWELGCCGSRGPQGSVCRTPGPGGTAPRTARCLSWGLHPETAAGTSLRAASLSRGGGWGLIVSAAPEHTGNKWVWKGETPQIFLRAVGSRQKTSGRSCWAPSQGAQDCSRLGTPRPRAAG